MREIKFRAWDKKMKVFKHPELWDSKMPSNWKYWYELQQFTGLKDKNGVEIYEGDICKVTYYNHSTPNSVLIQKVTYDLGTFTLVKNNTESKIEEDRTNVPLYYCFAPNTIEKIGTIHENPELL